MNNSLLRWFGILLRYLLVDNCPITLAAALGFAAIYILLPRPRAASRAWGIAAGGAALLLTGALIVRVGRFSPETVLFYAFSAVAIIAGALLITQSNPARAALSFALVVLSTCGIFLLQAAPFLMAATTIIYAGAIVVTFLFVIMLAQQEGLSDADQRSREPLLASLTGFILLGALLCVLRAGYGTEDIDTLLNRLQQAKEKPSVAEMASALGDSTGPNPIFFDRFRKAITKGGDSPETHTLTKEITDLEFEWMDALRSQNVDRSRQVVERLEMVGIRARASYGSLQPPPSVPLSSLSGPPANEPLFTPLRQPAEGKPSPGALRRDPNERPVLPHENTAYLGRALFTDYLLAVELGGTVLLVATIGAIAIATRRTSREPSGIPPVPLGSRDLQRPARGTNA